MTLLLLGILFIIPFFIGIIVLCKKYKVDLMEWIIISSLLAFLFFVIESFLYSWLGTQFRIDNIVILVSFYIVDKIILFFILWYFIKRKNISNMIKNSKAEIDQIGKG